MGKERRIRNGIPVIRFENGLEIPEFYLPEKRKKRGPGIGTCIVQPNIKKDISLFKIPHQVGTLKELFPPIVFDDESEKFIQINQKDPSLVEIESEDCGFDDFPSNEEDVEVF